MSRELFAYYFENIEYRIQSGKGISVFNADDELFSNFLTQARTSNRKIAVFKSSDYLKDVK